MKTKTTSKDPNLKENRLYNDLAWLWPLWGDPGEYAAYCENITWLIRNHAQRKVHTLLNICCGGGKNAFNLKAHFTVTGLDLSENMLKNARALNPDCRFIQADMRNFSLPDRYDSILIDDGIGYITKETDLRRVFKCAYDHLEPGGIMIVGPDNTKEDFIQNETAVTNTAAFDSSRKLDVTFIENNYDPDPEDTEFEALIIYVIHENGRLRIENDMHYLGLFSIEMWRGLLKESGFIVSESIYTEDNKNYTEFVCTRSK